VLGGLLLDNSTWDSIADRLRAEDFYRRDHQQIFMAIADSRPAASRATRSRWPSTSRRRVWPMRRAPRVPRGLARDTPLPPTSCVRRYVRERSLLSS